jgi:hypothetical protein
LFLAQTIRVDTGQSFHKGRFAVVYVPGCANDVHTCLHDPVPGRRAHHLKRFPANPHDERMLFYA